MKKGINLKLFLLAGFAVVLGACGGSRNAAKDPFLSSLVEKLDVQLSKMWDQGGGQYQEHVRLYFEGGKIVLSLQTKSEEITDEELQGIMVFVETMKFSPDNVFQVRGEGFAGETEVWPSEIFGKLYEMDVDFEVVAKDKDGNIIAEGYVKAGKFKELEKKAKEKEEKKKKDEEESAVFFASVEKGTFTDPRDNHTYRTGTVVRVTFMVDDLVYGSEAATSCGAGEKTLPDSCDATSWRYKAPDGKLYAWDEAKIACPAGWRLPSAEELEGGRFKKFWPDYLRGKDDYDFWSSSTKKDSGKEYVEVVQYRNEITECGRGAAKCSTYSINKVNVPMDQANVPENKKLIRCVKK